MKKVFIITTLCLLCLSHLSFGQTYDSDTLSSAYHFKAEQLIAPAILIGTGSIGLTSDWVEGRNHDIRTSLTKNIDHRITIDDFSQFAPLASVYVLNLCGLKGEHNMHDYSTILVTSAILMEISVGTLKLAIREQRPDGTSYDSFPSGHTATAFMGAELLRHEYWKVSPWIGIAGYAVATGTGFFRMYNNRHWLTDVLAGAGIGILCAKASYWLFPYISKKLFKKRRKSSNSNLSGYGDLHLVTNFIGR